MNTYQQILDALHGNEAPSFTADGGLSWPPEATAVPPEFPFNFDRHTYGDRGPLMAERLAR